MKMSGKDPAWIKWISARSASENSNGEAAFRALRLVAGAAKTLAAPSAVGLPGGLSEMKRLVTNQAGDTMAQPPVAGRRLYHAGERMPIELDRSFALATADQYLQPLHRYV